MHQTIHARLGRLERVTPDQTAGLVIQIWIVSPACPDAPRVRARFRDQEFHRAPEESEDAFLDRVKNEARSLAPGLPAYQLFLHGCEPSELDLWRKAAGPTDPNKPPGNH